MITIYEIIGPDNKSYVGHTKFTIEKRWEIHQNDARKKKRPGCRLLNQAIRLHGAAAFRMRELCKVLPAISVASETRAIRLFASLHPNGYNLQLRGSRRGEFKMTQENRATVHHGKLKNSPVKFEEEPKGFIFPPHLIRFRHPDNPLNRGYKIHEHPKCKGRYFCSTDPNPQIIPILLKRAMDAYAEYEKPESTPYKPRGGGVKKRERLPEGIRQRRVGKKSIYEARKPNGETKTFSDGKTMKTRLEAAKKWLVE